MQNYKNLKIWKKGRELVVDIYNITKALPGTERYGLVTQMQRSSVSIVANIAEGSARNSKKEFHQFLAISLGSIAELECYLYLLSDLRIIKFEDINKVLENTNYLRMMIITFKKVLR